MERAVGHPEHMSDSRVVNPSESTGWIRVDPCPLGLRYNPTAVWTGEEVIVFGGTDTYNGYDDGAAFDPRQGRWRLIAPNPFGALVNQVAVWTGTEMLVWGIEDDRSGTAGAAFDPVTDGWREIPAAPLPRLVTAEVAWTGREWVIWGGDAVPDSHGPGGPSDRGAAYDPASDRWRVLAPAPLAGRRGHALVWSDAGLIVWGGTFDVEPGLRGDGALYAPDTDRWELLPPAPVGPRGEFGATRMGDEVVIVGGWVPMTIDASQSVVAYHPHSRQWRLLPDLRRGLRNTTALWTGSQLLCFNGSDGLHADDNALVVLDPASDTWIGIPGRPVDPAWAVWTGSELFTCGQVPYTTDAAAWIWSGLPQR